MPVITQNHAFLAEQMSFLSLRYKMLTARHLGPGVGQVFRAPPFYVSAHSSQPQKSAFLIIVCVECPVFCKSVPPHSQQPIKTDKIDIPCGWLRTDGQSRGRSYSSGCRELQWTTSGERKPRQNKAEILAGILDTITVAFSAVRWWGRVTLRKHAGLLRNRPPIKWAGDFIALQCITITGLLVGPLVR